MAATYAEAAPPTAAPGCLVDAGGPTRSGPGRGRPPVRRGAARIHALGGSHPRGGSGAHRAPGGWPHVERPWMLAVPACAEGTAATDPSGEVGLLAVLNGADMHDGS